MSTRLFSEEFIRGWQSPQTELGKVFRWGDWVDEENPRLRLQSTMAHTAGISTLACAIVPVIEERSTLPLASALLLQAFPIHDVSEGPLGRDVRCPDKTAQKDLEEYRMFEKMMRHLGPVAWKSLRRAFLLQFAGENPECFPAEAREVMADLQEQHANEIRIFKAIEELDYILYAYEAYTDFDEKNLLTEILAGYAHKMKMYAEIIPGFEEFWTPQQTAWAEQFLVEYHPQLAAKV